MKKYEKLLQVVRGCDYRVFDGEYYRKEDGSLAVQGLACGCQAAESRCLLGRGGWARDRHQVNPNDCLMCIKKENEENGRALDEDSEAGEAGDGVSDDHNEPPGSDRSHGTAIGGSLVPVSNESDIEREILRLEREFQEIWFDIVNLQNFRNPATEQGLAALSNTLGTGRAPSFPPTPTGFGCDGGMPMTLTWHDPVFGDQSMTYNPLTGQYESTPATVNTGACCGCGAQTGVPVQFVYSPAGVTMKYKGDGSGCPTPGSPTDPLNNSVPFNNNGVSFCDGIPGDFGTNPMDPASQDCSTPGGKIYSCTPDPFGTVDTPVSGGSLCTYIPRTLFFRESVLGVWTLRYIGSNTWKGSKSVSVPAIPLPSCGCPAGTTTVTVTYISTSSFVPADYVGTGAACADDSGGISWQGEQWSLLTTSCNPFLVNGSLSDTGSACGPWAGTPAGGSTFRMRG